MQTIKFILAITFLIPVFSFGRVDTFRTRVQLAARHALYDSNFDHIRIWVDPDKENLLRDAFAKATSIKKFGDTANAVAQDFFLIQVISTQDDFINSAEYASISKDIEESFITNSLLKLNAGLSKADQTELERRFLDLSTKSEFPPGNIDAGRQFANDYNELIRFIASNNGVADNYSNKKISDDDLVSSQPIAFTVLAVLIAVIFLLHFIIVHHERKKKKANPTRQRHTIH